MFSSSSRRRLLPALLIVSLGAIMPAGEATPFTVATLVVQAREHAPTADAVVARRAAVAAQIRAVGAWQDPSIDLSGGRARIRDGDGERVGIGSVGLSQALPSPWRRSAAIAAAQAGMTVADAEAAQAWLELESAVRSAAADHAATTTAISLAEDATAMVQRLRTAVDARVRAGEAARTELARLEVEDAQAALALDGRRRDRSCTAAILATWCGTTVTETTAIVDALPARFPELPREVLVRTACDQGPLLRRIAAEREVLLAEQTVAQRAWQPELTVGGALNREADANSWELSLGVTVPLWDGGRAARDRTIAELAAGDARRREALAGIEREIIAAWNDYERERRRHTAISDRIAPAADEALRLTLASFQAGSAAFADLMDARRTVQRTAEDLLDARRQAHAAWLRLATLTGDFTLGMEKKP